MGYHKKHKENEVKADYWFESNLREYNKYVARKPSAIFCPKCLGSDVQHYSWWSHDFHKIFLQWTDFIINLRWLL